ncbi:molybdopterin-dependent oxidoreductase [Cytobacillus spongiae]|uniref:molybdopterin-dependent oxidoreductase n=1 Tax=Cytobacillus spongiae TaxID=2901381 RepID=UPI001F431D84|nr:molybdopterin-dependent oxidoreductase [Cytobacillus spongiae]UII56382.1 molybdopterin-dependent oxidoreductase [Cytobacillus spongiae]
MNDFTRRTFLKGSAALGAMLGVGSTSSFKKVQPTTAHAAGKTKQVFNSCPRNCYDTCSIVTTVEDGTIKYITGNKHNTYTNGRLCVKGFTYPNYVYSPDRIKYPMKQKKRGSGKWERISWDEAYEIIAKKIIEIKQKHGSTLPIALNKYSGNFNVLSYGVEGMMASWGYTTRAQGTPCWPAGIDSQTFDFGTILNSDPEEMGKAKYLIIWGANPAWTSVHSMSIIQKAKENGTKVVVIDPIMTDTAAKADEYIEIKASTDGALALGMAKYILDHHLHDLEWMKKNSIGYEEYLNYLRNNITLEWASEKTGVPVGVIERLAREYAAAKPASIWIGYGMQRHINGGAAVRSIDALAAMSGNIGVVGGGANYAQLDSWGFNYAAQVAGVYPEGSAGEADRMVNINNFPAQVLDINNDPNQVPIEMLWVACRNPIAQDPETSVSYKAFDSIDFIVTADLWFNETVNQSDIVLPVTSIFETWGLHSSYWHYWMNINEPAIDPLYESKCDVEIAMGISKKLNELQPGSSTYPTDRTMEEWVSMEMSDAFIERFGFKTWKDILEKGTAKVTGYEAAWADGKFRTPSTKYEFLSKKSASYGNHALPVYVEEMEVPKERPIRLLSPHWKYGLHSQFQNLAWMQSVHNEPFMEIHPILAKQKGIKEGSIVKVSSDIGFVEIKAKLTQSVPKDAIVIYEAWYKDKEFNVNYLLKAIPADMGSCATGQAGLAFHDQFVTIEKM